MPLHRRRRITLIDIIPRLTPHPPVIHLPRRERQTKTPVDKERDQKPDGVRDVVETLDAHGGRDAQRVEEPVQVGRDGDDVRREGARVEAVQEVVRGVRVAGVEGRDGQVAPVDDVVVAHEDAADGGEEDLVGGEEVDEDRCRGEEVPGADGY